MGQPRELMDRATAALLGDDLEALRAVYADDVVVTTPDAGTLHGVDAFIEWNRAFSDAMSDLDYQPLQKHETAQCAIDQGEIVGTHTGPLALPDGSTLAPTGKQVRVREIDVATVENGKIVRHDIYFDQLEVLTQLGLMEAPAQTTA